MLPERRKFTPCVYAIASCDTSHFRQRGLNHAHCHHRRPSLSPCPPTSTPCLRRAYRPSASRLPDPGWRHRPSAAALSTGAGVAVGTSPAPSALIIRPRSGLTMANHCHLPPFPGRTKSCPDLPENGRAASIPERFRHDVACRG